MVKILLVDDSEYVRNTLNIILTYVGHDVVGEATNAKEAIQKYKTLLPEIVLLDIVLKIDEGVTTGLDALKEILRFDPKAKVLVCSALNQQALISQSIKIGAKGFIAKPFQPEKLIEAVKMCTDLDPETRSGKQSSKMIEEQRNAGIILV